ncbi:hypothetical protein QQS21_011622 [Conoideocrella luteorostrata]|uniref:Carboxylesterase type B domain-containing protein n=1 Tax=Conoideocrella luteorostrata TaxID=1105319 RepID=A0AAJ0FTJ7_9HYPO|nr:hypothetical protein QQS21_011622 [Conoideocrella luteorostrata]
MLGSSSTISTLVLVLAGAGFGVLATNELPVVDLGYALHRAKWNATGDYYAFNNIRFADPPTGKNRFQPPVPVSTTSRDTIYDASDAGTICTQGYPEWTLVKLAKTVGGTAAELRKKLESDPRNSEDCLFLNVVVPRSIYGKGGGGKKGRCHRNGAPVMVWIYGGGFTSGLKDDELYNPAGLFARAQENGGEGIIYVALNYRLGLYGWMNGLGDKAGVPNVGLLDQRLGLEWCVSRHSVHAQTSIPSSPLISPIRVKKYIHLFGGDPNRVTAFGESAGGGSIMHHLTAGEGNEKMVFKRALIQSPGYQTNLDLPGIFHRILSTASTISGRPITNIAELASLDAPTLYKVNSKVIADSPESSYTFGPTIDGTYVRDLPTVRLLQGKFDPTTQLMLGHNLHEGLAYITPEINTTAQFAVKIDQAFPAISRHSREYILNVLYPPAPQPAYKDDNARAVLLFTEAFFACNTRGLATAHGNRTWNYRFQIPPATHGQDVAYTFYRGGTNATNATIGSVALAMQRYFTKFGKFGNPNAHGGMQGWERYGREAKLVTFGKDGVGADTDELVNRRCDYWLRAGFRE